MDRSHGAISLSLWIRRRVRRLCRVSISRHGQSKGLDDKPECRAGPLSWFFGGAREVGEVHSGFTLAVRHSWEAIANVVDKVMPRPPASPDLKGLSTSAQPTLWLTGHSLGGALAVLCGAAFSMTNTIRLVSGVYTFGQPRVGLFNFCNNYNHLLSSRTFRFVNREDLVPRVTFRGWDYADVGDVL